MDRVILVPPRPQTDLVTLVFKGDSPVPSEYAPSGPHLDLVTLVHTWASSDMVPLHGLQVGLTWNWEVWSLPGHHLDMFPLHGMQVGLTWTW